VVTGARRCPALYVEGPFDYPIEIMRTLRSSVGDDGFAVAA
jgi:hypothetical protein